VRNEDVSTVKHHVLQHLPVFQFDKNNFAGDAQVWYKAYKASDKSRNHTVDQRDKESVCVFCSSYCLARLVGEWFITRMVSSYRRACGLV